jgi:hypothetical protein
LITMPKIMTRASILALTTFAVLYLVACGGGDAMLPTSASPAAGSFATISGTLDDGITASSNDDVRMASRWVGIKVTVVQTGQSTETNQAGQFVITVPAGTVTLRFEGRGLNAELEIGGLVAGQTLTITVHASGSHADLDDGKGEAGPHDSCFAAGAKAEVEGLISAKAADSITVTQQGKGDFLCLFSSSTRIRKGNRTLTVEDLAIGGRVHVTGTGGGATGGACVVDATEIKVQ